MIEKLKNSMKPGFCDGILLECLTFISHVKEGM